tara:strand:+ start:101 stop:517 length:417 start_codon:yes stop_codon:yes gene_type:complete
MAKHLTELDIDNILELLDGWDGKLTWVALCKRCPAVIGTEPSRQTLSSYPRILDAYKQLKLGGKGSAKSTSDNIPKPQSLAIAAQRIMRLSSENERLKRENRALLEQFTVWQYNAHINQLTEEQLNKPLPPIDRELTE